MQTENNTWKWNLKSLCRFIFSAQQSGDEHQAFMSMTGGLQYVIKSWNTDIFLFSHFFDGPENFHINIPLCKTLGNRLAH